MVLSEANTPEQTAKIVWDEPLIDHTSAGTTGRVLSLIDYDNVVWIDTLNGFSGTTYPIGTRGYKVNNALDAASIAGKQNIQTFNITGELISQRPISNVTIGGRSWINDSLILQGYHYNSVIIENLYLSGNLNASDILFERCYLNDINEMEGEVIDSRISGTIYVASGKTFSGVGIVVEGDAIIDLQGQPCTVSLDVDSGYITFINSVAGCLIEIGLGGGEIELDPSCTGGDFYIQGDGTLYGDPIALGMNLIGNNLLGLNPIADYVWEKTLP